MYLVLTVLLLLLLFLVPTGPPTSFSVTADNTNPELLMLSWSLPDEDYRNGIIIRYYYNCVNNDNDISSGDTQETTATISNLLVFTEYTCTVRAATVIGIGDASAMNTTTTGEAGMYSCTVGH